MPFPNLKIFNEDSDKRTAISVVRDEIKILKSQVPTQNIVLSPLVRNIPSDVSGFFLDAELGLVILVTSSTETDIYNTLLDIINKKVKTTRGYKCQSVKIAIMIKTFYLPILSLR